MNVADIKSNFQLEPDGLREAFLVYSPDKSKCLGQVYKSGDGRFKAQKITKSVEPGDFASPEEALAVFAVGEPVPAPAPVPASPEEPVVEANNVIVEEAPAPEPVPTNSKGK